MTENTPQDQETPLPRPTRERPAKWLKATEIVVGDIIVTKGATPEEREAGIWGGQTGRITGLRTNGKKGQARRWFVEVDGAQRYPNGISDKSPVLILR